MLAIQVVCFKEKEKKNVKKRMVACRSHIC